MDETTGPLPGEEWLRQGLHDLSRGFPSIAAYLVLIGAPRLRRLGVSIPFQKELSDCPEHALYQHLQNENPRGVHSRYNALIRRWVSFERALEKNKRMNQIDPLERVVF